MSRLTRDGTAVPVSLYQILRRERGQLATSRIDNLTRIILTFAIMCDLIYLVQNNRFLTKGSHRRTR